MTLGVLENNASIVSFFKPDVSYTTAQISTDKHVEQ